MGIPGQVFEQIGEIGKQVVQEAAKVPADITGKAIESLGASSGKKPQGQSGTQGSAARPTEGAVGELETAKDEQTKKAIARAALSEIAGVKPKEKEPSVWERLQMEEKQKAEQAKKQQEVQARQQMPAGSSKRRRGDLYGMKAKKAGSEMSKNVKQE